MADLKYLPQWLQQPTAIVLVLVVLAGGATTLYLQWRAPTSSASEAWRDVATTTDPCVLEHFTRTYPNDASYVQLARQKANTLGPCRSSQEVTTEPNTPARTEPASSTTRQRYDLASLHPDVRTAVERARDYAQRADSVATQARAEAERARDAAERARSGESGYRVLTTSNGVEYAGQYGEDGWNGYAVVRFANGRYEGQLVNGSRSGLGVYYFNDSPDGSAVTLEGQWVDGKTNGLAVTTYTEGRTAGARRAGAITGPNVYTCPGRCRREGDWIDGNAHGFHVVWTLDGYVFDAGVFADNELTTPLAP